MDGVADPRLTCRLSLSPRLLRPQSTIKSYKWSILLLALSATLREGIESVLFLTGVSQVGRLSPTGRCLSSC